MAFLQYVRTQEVRLGLYSKSLSNDAHVCMYARTAMRSRDLRYALCDQKLANFFYTDAAGTVRVVY
jgi:hypothetical protein